jgi:ankyrin repeat protein
MKHSTILPKLFKTSDTLLDNTPVNNIVLSNEDLELKANDDGWTVAHILARFGRLPDTFTNLELADNNGWSVAHVLARIDKLPETFTNLELADKDGWTVAHVLASRHKLPVSFTNLELKDNTGISVEFVCSIFNNVSAVSEV